MVDFQRPPNRQQGGKGPGTFDFLGFTHYWKRSRRGNWTMAVKTRRARLKRAIKSIYDWCRSHRHESIPAQHAALKRKSGCGDAASARASTGIVSTTCYGTSRYRHRRYQSPYGRRICEPYWRRSPLVEISSIGIWRGHGLGNWPVLLDKAKS